MCDYPYRIYQGLDRWWYVRGPFDYLLGRFKTEQEARQFAANL